VVAALARRIDPLPFVAIATAAAIGALTAVSAPMGVGVFFGAAALVLAWTLPVVHLTLLVGLLAIVPFEMLNRYSLGGGVGSAGLTAPDVLLATGLSRAAWVLLNERLPRRQAVLCGLVSAFLLIALLGALNGVWSGAELSNAGTELRALLGFGAALVALPIVRDPAGRRRLMGALLALGLALGLWGVLQWLLGVSFGETGDVGIRQDVAETTSGRGHLLGGLFGFPVPVIVGFAVLLSGAVTAGKRTLLLVMVALNGVGVLLTYERTFWLVTAVAMAFVALRSGRVQRARALLAAPLVFVLVLVPLTLLEQSAVKAAGERLLSLGRYATDSSVAYRLRESSYVLERIQARPFTGSGLGATIYWGRPERDVPAKEYTFSHNGGLRVAWKLGIPAALLLFAGLAAAVAQRLRMRGPPLDRAFVLGCQGAVLALLIVNVTFPSVTALSCTAVLGVLVAFTALAGVRDPGQADPA
jgi:hypothetical protein